MLVKLSNGKTIRIQFVHSSHSGFPVENPTPGGLRQLVDNIAFSLDRRITLCEIAEVKDGEFLTSDPESQVPRQYVPLAQGIAVCYKKDQFKKLAGRSIALIRALANAELSGPVADLGWTEEVWQAFPKEDRFIADVESGALKF